MAAANVSTFLRQLTRGMAAETLREESDQQLVGRLLAGRDEAAFEAIVRRHGPMVYRVCWRVLQQAQDCEDAFQATFLILAQRLDTVRRQASLASWLHGVAHRTALQARTQGAARRRHEHKTAGRCQAEDVTWRELLAELDAELLRLPEKWRAPLILCYLEGRTQDEAAGQLGWALRTLRRRLDEARAALGRRLTDRGVVWSAALSAVLLSDCVASAALAPRLIGSTVDAAACLTSGNAVLSAAVSAKVAALTQGVMRTMFVSKLKIAAAALVLLAAFAGGMGGLLDRTQAGQPPRVPKSELVRAPLDARKPVVVREDAQVQQVAWSADGKVVATICTRYEVGEGNDGMGGTAKYLTPQSTVKVWDATTGKLVKALGEEKDTSLRAITLSPDKKYAAVAGFQTSKVLPGFVRILDAQTWAVRHEIDDLPSVYALAFSPDGKTLAIGGNGPTKTGTYVSLWDVPGGKMRAETKLRAPAGPVPPGVDESWYLSSLVFSPDGRVVAATESNLRDRRAKIQLYDVDNGAAKHAVDVGKSNGIFGAAFTADGKSLVSGCGSVKFWDASTGKEQRAFDVKGWKAWSVAASPDGRLLAVVVSREVKGKWSNAVVLCDAKTGEEKQTLHPETSAIWLRSLAFSRDGKSLAVAGFTDADSRVKDGDKTKGELRITPVGR
jgi:RNA polymerase sigma factor (sigma-70 family)